MTEQRAPSTGRHRWLERYMYVVGVGGNLFFYIQAGKIFYYRHAEGVSVLAFGVALWAVMSWFVYGLALENRVLIVANIVGTIGAALVVTGCLLYG